MEKSSVWSKVGAWFRRDGPNDAFAVQSNETPPPVTAPDEPSGASDAADVAQVGAPSEFIPPPRTNGPVRSGDSKSGGASGNDLTAALVASIKEHLEAQVQGADVLVGSLDRLADGLELLPDAAKNELGVLERLSSDVAGVVGTLKRLETTLSQMPSIAGAQRAAVVALTHELSCSRETDEKTAGVLEGVQGVMVELRDGVGRWSGAMGDLRTEMADRHERLTLLVERQAQRFVWLAVAAVALGGVAAILGIVTLFR